MLYSNTNKTNKFNSVAIIIPTYNEEKTLPRLLAKVLTASTSGLKKEVIVIDDGSNDNTKQILEQFKKQIKILSHSHNKGKGASIRNGLKHTKSDIIIIQDADLEYDPGEYSQLLKPILEHSADVVYGSRKLSGENPYSSPLFNFGGWLTTAIVNRLFRSNLTDVWTGYKIFNYNVISSIVLRCQRFEFCPEVTAKLLKKNIPIKEVPITYRPRNEKEGKKIKIKDGIQAIWTLFRIRFIG